MSFAVVTICPPPVYVNNGQLFRGSNATKKAATMSCSFQATPSKKSSTGVSCSLQTVPLMTSTFMGHSVLSSKVEAGTLGNQEGRTSRVITRAMFPHFMERAMFQHFTEKGLKAIAISQKEAKRMGHNFVGTEQILLGLIGQDTGIAAKVLKSLGIDLHDARAEVMNIIGHGSGFVALEMPFSPRAERVLELALEETQKLGHNNIGPEHLLLGLLQEGEGVGVRVLEKLGADRHTIRTKVILRVLRCDAISAGDHTLPLVEEGEFPYATTDLLKKMKNERHYFQKLGEQRDREMGTREHISAPVLQNKETTNETEAGKGLAATESYIPNDKKFPTELTISCNGEPANFTVNRGASHSITLSISSSEKVKIVIGFSENSETSVTVRY